MSIIGPPPGIGAPMRAHRAKTQAWRGWARKSRDARSPGYPGGGEVGVYAGPPGYGRSGATGRAGSASAPVPGLPAGGVRPL